MTRCAFNLATLWPGRALSVYAIGCVLVCAVPTLAAEAPWVAYNEGVEAYAKRDYPAAFQRWQDLSIQSVPRSLLRPLWFQLGNVQFRLGEPLEEGAPEQAVELWRRSCEAYRSALVTKPRDADVRHNLALVERRLAALSHRLGMDAFRSAGNKQLDEAITLLHASTEHLEEAANLVPDDSQVRGDRDQAWQTLRTRLKERAQTAETKGDEFARQNNAWANEEAEGRYRAALEDLAEARRPPENPGSVKSPNPAYSDLDQSVALAQDRVNHKLAQLLTRSAQREQQQGDQQAQGSPDRALDHYEAALDLYRAALEAQPGKVEAQTGEREVRLAIEKLHVREGHAQLERGKEALVRKSPRSAAPLSSALSHYEAALQLNPSNTEARAGADEARRLLPEALTLSGQAELEAGERAERQSVTDALGHYQEAENDFRQSLELKANQPSAERGLSEAEGKLARLRQKAAQEAEKTAEMGRPQNQPPKTLKSLLGQVDEAQRLPELDRQRQKAQRNTRPGRQHADW